MGNVAIGRVGQNDCSRILDRHISGSLGRPDSLRDATRRSMAKHTPKKNQPKGRKRNLRVVVRIVPQGTLHPNPLNPHYDATPANRREGLLRSAVFGLIRVLRDEEITDDETKSAVKVSKAGATDTA